MSATFLQAAAERRFPGARVELLHGSNAFRVTRVVGYEEIAALARDEKVRWLWRALEPVRQRRSPHWSLLGRRRRP